MEEFKSLINSTIKILLTNLIITLSIFILFITIISYLFPSFSESLDKSTKWLSNITPLVVLAIVFFVKEEITNWHYKKRSEAASEIIGNFRFCSKDLTYWIHARSLTPCMGEESAERKIYISINKYIDDSLVPSAQFPIHLRKELDTHFKDMRILINTLSGAIEINTATEPKKMYGAEMLNEANKDLRTIEKTLLDIQDFLDEKFAIYLNQ